MVPGRVAALSGKAVQGWGAQISLGEVQGPKFDPENPHRKAGCGDTCL